ncbi:hypothetical protein PENSPDRAFT_571055 [Peniophora sp. CONT]|nr:hypothetical protein PENSPDRAFT_571055 [Peniophora sp. CONT]
MQRRTVIKVPSSPLLAPPTPGIPTSQITPGLDKPVSRLSARTFGLPNRIWLIVGLFGSLILFTRLVLPAHTSDASYYLRSHSSAYTSSLKPHNYLNASGAHGENPFAFCPTFGEGDELSARYGALTVSQSWLHLGSGARIQKVLHKALLGQPVTISVLGGSVSACHGAGDDPIAAGCYPHRFFDWWNTIFPHPASELTNGALRKTNSEYFAFCAGHHLPDYTDLVIIELDTDDKADKQTIDHFELLVRSILLRPDSPAILVLGHFSPQTQEQNGFAGPDTWHSVVAQYYDIPHISTKSALYAPYINSPSAISQYYTDPILANSAGHGVLSDVLVAYIQSQVCTAWAAVTGGGAQLPVYYALGGGPEQEKSPTDARKLFGGAGVRGPEEDDENHAPAVKAPSALAAHFRVPSARLSARPADLSERVYEEIAPHCASANDLVNPLPPSLFAGSGWIAHHPSGAAARGAADSASHYWVATMPQSKLRVPLQMGAGDVGIYYVREPAAVLGVEGGSRVACWVDDNVKGRVTFSNIGSALEPEPAVQMIDHWVARGPHYVECELLGEEGQTVPPFKIIGVFTT